MTMTLVWNGNKSYCKNIYGVKNEILTNFDSFR